MLTGLRVLIVRPPRTDDPFARGITALGGNVHQLPVMRIDPVADDDAVIAAAIDDFADYDKAIFLSRHAAHFGLHHLRRRWSRLPADVQYFAVGATTAEFLRQRGLAVACPALATTEGLLALPELESLAGQRLLILRGHGGREILAQSLVDRGARVDCCELYRRVIDFSRSGDIAAVLANPDRLLIAAHSAELLDALVAVTRDQGLPWLLTLPVLVPSRRVAKRAQALGFACVIVAASALAEHMVAASRRWYTKI